MCLDNDHENKFKLDFGAVPPGRTTEHLPSSGYETPQFIRSTLQWKTI